jgi:hypothetical protein
VTGEMSGKTRVRRALLLLALFGSVGFAFASGFPLCPTAGMFGIPCPGCGLSRAMFAALRGDFADAFYYHPLFFVIGPVYLAALAAAAVALFQAPPPARPARIAPRRLGDRAVTAGASALLVAMLGVWALRFAGWFGGPAPVTTFAEWSQHEHPSWALTASR